MSDCQHDNTEYTAWHWGDRNRYAMSDHVVDLRERWRTAKCRTCGEEWAEVQTLQVKEVMGE